MEEKIERNISVGWQLSLAKGELCQVVLGWYKSVLQVHTRGINLVDINSGNRLNRFGFSICVSYY